MSDDPTRELPKPGSFEERVLAQLSAIRTEQAEMRTEQAEMRTEQAEMRAEQAATRKEIAALGARLNSVEERLSSLEDRVDTRLRETRPIWEAVQESIRRLDMKFETVLSDLVDGRTDVRIHEKRLLQLEEVR